MGVYTGTHNEQTEFVSECVDKVHRRLRFVAEESAFYRLVSEGALRAKCFSVKTTNCAPVIEFERCGWRVVDVEACSSSPPPRDTAMDPSRYECQNMKYTFICYCGMKTSGENPSRSKGPTSQSNYSNSCSLFSHVCFCPSRWRGTDKILKLYFGRLCSHTAIRISRICSRIRQMRCRLALVYHSLLWAASVPSGTPQTPVWHRMFAPIQMDKSEGTRPGGFLGQREKKKRKKSGNVVE